MELLDAAVGAQDERGRMPGAGEHHPEVVAVAIEPGQRRAREARVARLLLLQHDLVDDLQRGGRLRDWAPARSEWRTTLVMPAARASLPWTSPIATPTVASPIAKTS